MLAALILTFAAVFLLVFALWSAIGAIRKTPTATLKHRLRRMAGNEWDNQATDNVKNIFRKETPVEQIIHRLPLQGPVGRLLEYSGTRLSPTIFTILNFGAFTTGFIVVLVLKGNLPLALGGGILSASLPSFILKIICVRRRSKLDEQIPDALILISRSLQAGHSLAGAVEMVGQMMPEPAGGLFRVTYEQQKLGMRITDAVASLPERIDSVDLRFFVTIVKMNNEIGGGLSETLEKLAETVRSRVQVRRQIRVYTSEGRISGYILSGLPFVVFGMICVVSPGYMEPFFTNETCRYVLYAVLAAQAVGFLVIQKIVNIRI